MNLLEALAIRSSGWSSSIPGQPEAFQESCRIVNEAAKNAFRTHRIAALRAELSKLEADSDGGECD